ncbi:spermidine/putrescine ABC transporter substrate-binding protein [Acrocarpospora phusangensis]|uniref:Spermidine/putrescine ABC transporter substrate-binding protein n=1 Tax=Acrocarpospora phusangensis TaxID=1070424 RepID=A0A919QH00_9ACTN|nr:spermidine/putrescine ABC transporter substrate-binding protein [Acrocarpospora phusangensis]GIH27225.1 spermidine/putrescine ABC transporter substrate-binding protein [Acrocarpospora phusangensis]
MSRIRYTRHLPAAFTAAGLVLALAACGGSSTSPDSTAAAAPSATTVQLDPNADLSKQSLSMSIWEGYSPPDLPQRVKENLKFDLKIAPHATNEEIMAKLTAGATNFDLVFVSGQYAQALNEAGLLEPLHPELIPNLANLYPEAANLSYDKGNAFSVPYTWGTTGICYRTDMVDAEPTSWNDILAPTGKARGKVLMMTTERWLALPALKALKKSINTSADADLAAAKDLLLKAKSTMLAFDDVTFGDKLKAGQAAMAVAWDGWCPTDDPKIKFKIPSEGSDLWADTMVIMKSSKNKEAAHAFINYILDPKVHGWVAANILYKVPNKAAMDQVDPSLMKTYPALTMTPAELLQGESIIDLGQDSVKYTRLSSEIQAAQ